MEDKFLELVADILNVKKEEITMESSYGEVPNWDSVMMLNLIMELEEEFNCSIPIEKVSKGITLKELFALTQK